MGAVSRSCGGFWLVGWYFGCEDTMKKKELQQENEHLRQRVAELERENLILRLRLMENPAPSPFPQMPKPPYIVTIGPTTITTTGTQPFKVWYPHVTF